MEVPNRQKRSKANLSLSPPETVIESVSSDRLDPGVGMQLEGRQLIDTLVTLTGLPEPFAQQEMNELLSLSGHDDSARSDITLDELRQALINYLEAFRPTEETENAEERSESAAFQPYDA